MWEFSLNIKSENASIVNKVYNFLKSYFDMMEGIVTLHDENGYKQVLVAINEEKMELGKRAITSCIIDIICVCNIKHCNMFTYWLSNRNDSCQ